MTAELNPDLDPQRGWISWFTRNPVAANLLMVGIIVAGVAAGLNLQKQMFPQVEINRLTITVPYPGAAPVEVEETITLKLEDALKGVQGIERLITRSYRGTATAEIQVLQSYDPGEVLEEVKAAVDTISSFPAGIEQPRITQQRFEQEVLWIMLSGGLDRAGLKRLGETIYSEIRNLPGVDVASLYGGADFEIAIEIEPQIMREYQLSFAEVADAVRAFSTNRSAGEIRAVDGFISVRVNQQAYVGREFERLPLRTLADGSVLTLGQIATIKDDFTEGIERMRVDGEDAVVLFVGASRDQDITTVSQIVHRYMGERQQTLPAGVQLEPFVDLTYYLNGRLNMMFSNMFYGALLVFVVLALFLRMKLAFWVMMGIPISFLGALAVLPYTGVTINIASLFAFIMVLGVVVDDAIIIGESVHAEVEEKGHSLDNVIRGAKRVAVPATFGVLTTMAAFWPMVIDDGPEAPFSHAIGFVVVLCLLFSLIESKFILPAHLAGMTPENPNSRNPVVRVRRMVDAWLASFVQRRYRPFVSRALTYRYLVVSVFLGLIVVLGGVFAGGHMKFLGMPKIPHDFAFVSVEMEGDTAESTTLAALAALQQMVSEVDAQVEREFGAPMVAMAYSEINSRTQFQLQVKLVDPEVRPLTTFELSDRWRAAMPPIAGIKTLTIIDSLDGGGPGQGDVSWLITGRDSRELLGARDILKRELDQLAGVSEVSDSEPSPGRELTFKLTSLGQSLGLTTSDVASQASAALYGLEAQRLVRDKQEIRVMVRYPPEYRSAVDAAGEVIIRTPTGAELPLAEIAQVQLAESADVIYREDGLRAINVWASLNKEQAQPLAVADRIRTEVLPEIKRQYPHVDVNEAGALRDERADTHQQLLNVLLILLPVYVLLALPLRSYTQPLIIMSVIPFGIMGAVFGHLLLGLDMSSISLFGIFAVVGVVVNDSLVMVDAVNRYRREGMPLRQAVVESGVRRFRPIVLTSLTTFIGLVPIISETSLQAQIVIPMAVSLAFGVLFATLVTLILVPALYVVGDDFRRKQSSPLAEPESPLAA